jgi:hypothetical protein
LPEPTGVITTSQVHRLRTDSGVRVLPPQPRSPSHRHSWTRATASLLGAWHHFFSVGQGFPATIGNHIENCIETNLAFRDIPGNNGTGRENHGLSVRWSLSHAMVTPDFSMLQILTTENLGICPVLTGLWPFGSPVFACAGRCRAPVNKAQCFCDFRITQGWFGCQVPLSSLSNGRSLPLFGVQLLRGGRRRRHSQGQCRTAGKERNTP